MSIRRKLNSLFCLALCACAGNLYAQQNAANIAPAEKPDAKVEELTKDDRAKPEPIKFEPPQIAQLTCPETIGVTPFLALTAKAKDGDQYQNVRIGCIDLGAEDALVNEQHQLGLDQAAQYIIGNDKFIRLYIDLEDAKIKDEEMLKRFRTKAFAVRKILTDKGVYDKLQANRGGVLPSRFAKNEENTTKTADKKSAPKTAARKKTKSKPKDISREYAFEIERKDTFVDHSGGEGIYGNEDGRGGFQFIPMQSVYFAHDRYELTNRAKSTLLTLTKYILAHPETDRIIVEGHADITASVDYNYRLTDRRTKAVLDFLIANGVPEEIIETLSRSEIEPLDEDWTRQGKSRNRRVSLYVIQREPILTPDVAQQ